MTLTTPLNSPACAMILAAGRGERMRPLTDTTPKPLLSVRGKPLMQWPLEALARGGCHNVVINTAWLGEQIAAMFGTVFPIQPPQGQGEQPLHGEQNPRTMAILYSHEGRDFGCALETAGGIVRALPLLGDVFWVLAGDVFAPDFAFDQCEVDRFMSGNKLAHIWLVPNPAHNSTGDFGLSPPTSGPGSRTSGLALNLSATDPGQRYTYSTIGLYRKALFAPPWCGIPTGNPEGIKAPLAPLLRAAMSMGLVSAEVTQDLWVDVGTPQRLEQINAA